MEQADFPGDRLCSVGGQGYARPELPAVGGMDYRQHGLLRIRVSVYRILRREGLVKRPEMRLAAGKEYHRKPPAPTRCGPPMPPTSGWLGWGYYYMVTVMDDYSRFILAHRLQRI